MEPIRFITTSFLCIFLIVYSVEQTKAHMIKADSGITATLHVSPDDDPTARVASEVHFEITSKQDEYGWEKCTCILTVEKGDELISIVPLTIRRGEQNIEAFADYAFPSKGIYKLHFRGTVLKGEEQHTFEIEFFQRVAKENAVIESSSNVMIDYILPACALCLISFGVGGSIFSKKKKA